MLQHLGDQAFDGFCSLTGDDAVFLRHAVQRTGIEHQRAVADGGDGLPVAIGLIDEMHGEARVRQGAGGFAAEYDGGVINDRWRIWRGAVVV